MRDIVVVVCDLRIGCAWILGSVDEPVANPTGGFVALGSLVAATGLTAGQQRCSIQRYADGVSLLDSGASPLS